ncbi:MAG: hypothetical protein Q8M40_06230 [Legionella sp.]|nr:hypothetical protein [Legionella sp.]
MKKSKKSPKNIVPEELDKVVGGTTDKQTTREDIRKKIPKGMLNHLNKIVQGSSD